jgi:hypothetical protein
MWFYFPEERAEMFFSSSENLLHKIFYLVSVFSILKIETLQDSGRKRRNKEAQG